MVDYVFFGRIYPERAAVHLSKVPFHSESMEMEISCHASQILVEVEVEEKVDNLDTLRNAVKMNVHRVTDILAFTQGNAYSAEITAVMLPDGGRRVFGVNVPTISEKISDEDRRERVTQAIFQAYSFDEGEYLRRSLRDLRLAMQEPEDSGFFVYRAIESARQYFKIEEEIGNDNDSWVRLREVLNRDKDRIDFVKEYAGETRHGGRVEINDEERQRILNIGWDAIDRFQQELLRRHH